MKIQDLPDHIRLALDFPYNLSEMHAIFAPVRTDDLRPEMQQYVGQVVDLMYAGTNGDDCIYPGEITCLIRFPDWEARADADKVFGWSGRWVPLSDLQPLKISEEQIGSRVAIDPESSIILNGPLDISAMASHVYSPFSVQYQSQDNGLVGWAVAREEGDVVKAYRIQDGEWLETHSVVIPANKGFTVTLVDGVPKITEMKDA